MNQYLVDYTVRNITTGDEEDIRVLELSPDEFDGFPVDVREQVRTLVSAVRWNTPEYDSSLWQRNQERIRELLLPFISDSPLYFADYEAWETNLLDEA